MSPVETEGWHSSGHSIPVEITLAHASVNGEPLALASIRDITRRRETDERNRMLMEQLTQAHKMKSLGTLVAGTAHDFNNMLAAIMGYASTLATEISHDQRHFQDVSQILKIAKRAKTLTENLLAFSRKTEPTSEIFSVNSVIKEVVNLLRRTIPKRISLKTKLCQNIFIEGDRSQLEQCLMNLCLNARDALPDGGEIHIHTSRKEFDEETAKQLNLPVAGCYCMISVKDNGIGMDSNTLRRAFDPFFSTKSRGEGSGLGLALVLAMARSHSGQARIESELGKGTKVYIYLATTNSRPTPLATSCESETLIYGQGETILLVDDEKYLRDMAKRLLEGLGYRVILAESGEEAVKIFRELHQHIDLIFLDVMLEGMSGSETFDKIKAINSQAKILVSSGYERQGEPRYLLSKGACGFIQKPYGMEEVNQAIREALKSV